jgi:HNH endonuclease
MHSPNDPIVRAVTRDPNVLARFWASVDRAESGDDCWRWRGEPNRDRHPVFRVKHHAVSVSRVAWFAATGEFPLGGRMRHTCENISCVRPEHLVWELGRMSDRVLRTRSDGYVSVAGISSAVRPNADDARYRRAS